MSRKHVAKPGYLGKSFYAWLAHLEFTERVIFNRRLTTADKKRLSSGRGYAFNDALWPVKPDSGLAVTLDQQTIINSETVRSMLPVDAYLAHLVRSSVKFRVTVDTLRRIEKEYPQELIQIAAELELNLPFESCTVCFEQDGENDIVVNLAEVEANERDPRAKELFELKQYPKLGIEAGEKFNSASMCFYRESGVEFDYKPIPGQKLSHCPVEIHFNKGRSFLDTIWLNAIAPGSDVSDRGKHIMETVQNLISVWLCTFELQAVLRRRQPGMGHARIALPQHPPLRPRKKYDRPMFEHFVIEMEIDQPADQQTGGHRRPHHKRLHQVRAYPRHHKQPIKAGPNKGKTVTWVKPHWRGNKDLGVIRNDFEMTAHGEMNP